MTTLHDHDAAALSLLLFSAKFQLSCHGLSSLGLSSTMAALAAAGPTTPDANLRYQDALDWRKWTKGGCSFLLSSLSICASRELLDATVAGSLTRRLTASLGAGAAGAAGPGQLGCFQDREHQRSGPPAAGPGQRQEAWALGSQPEFRGAPRRRPGGRARRVTRARQSPSRAGTRARPVAASGPTRA